MSEEWKVVGAIVAIMMASVAAVVGLFLWLTSWECASKSAAMNLPHTWGAMQGCIVTYKGEKVPIGAVGVRTIELHQK